MTDTKTPYAGTPFSLSGKTAMVSGGAGLLGCEFCKALLSAGANVILADKSEDRINAAYSDMSSSSTMDRILKQILDVTDPESIDKCVNSVMKEFGQIDILVNSAAIDPKYEKNSDISSFSKFPEFPKDLWEQSLAINLTGTFLLTQQVSRVMEKKSKGSIINLGSNYGMVGPDQRIYITKEQPDPPVKPVVYSVCKAGIIGFTKYLAAYYAGTEIRVNVLTPSGIINNHEKEFTNNYAERTILRRMSNKNEYWGSVIFLASDASSYMTGANLVVDGGWTAL